MIKLADLARKTKKQLLQFSVSPPSSGSFSLIFVSISSLFSKKNIKTNKNPKKYFFVRYESGDESARGKETENWINFYSLCTVNTWKFERAKAQADLAMIDLSKVGFKV